MVVNRRKGESKSGSLNFLNLPKFMQEVVCLVDVFPYGFLK